MLKPTETFFTTIGCMDGRSQQQAVEYGKSVFGAKFADIITEAGLVGHFITHTTTVQNKLMISVGKHHSKGVVVHGHQDCAGNPVDEAMHKKNVAETARIIYELLENSVPVHGIFGRLDENDRWTFEKVYP